MNHRITIHRKEMLMETKRVFLIAAGVLLSSFFKSRPLDFTPRLRRRLR